MKTDHELPLFRFRESLTAQLRQTRDVTKALRHSLRATREFFDASHAAIAVVQPGEPRAELLLSLPEDPGWDLELLAAFIGNRYPAIPPRVLIAPLRRGGRTWAALALQRVVAFDRGAIRVLLEIAAAVSESIERIDLERMLEVRDRIDRKMMERLRSNDLFYQILDGLRSLTRYDHSSALLIQDEDGALRLAAEQIAWVKGKSRRIGLAWRSPTRCAPPSARARSSASSVPGTPGWSGRAATSWPHWPSCSTTTARTRCARDPCCARRWPRATACWGAQDRLPAQRHLRALRGRPGAALPLPRGGGHPQLPAHRVAARAHGGGRAQARHGGSGPLRGPRREQRAGIGAAAGPADAGRSAGRAGSSRRCCAPTWSRSSARSRSAGGSSAGC